MSTSLPWKETSPGTEEAKMYGLHFTVKFEYGVVWIAYIGQYSFGNAEGTKEQSKFTCQILCDYIQSAIDEAVKSALSLKEDGKSCELDYLRATISSLRQNLSDAITAGSQLAAKELGEKNAKIARLKDQRDKLATYLDLILKSASSINTAELAKEALALLEAEKEKV